MFGSIFETAFGPSSSHGVPLVEGVTWVAGENTRITLKIKTWLTESCISRKHCSHFTHMLECGVGRAIRRARDTLDRPTDIEMAGF